MDKKLMLTIAITTLIAGALGFFGGRYFEQKTFKNRFQQMRGGNMMQRGEWNNNNQVRFNR